MLKKIEFYLRKHPLSEALIFYLKKVVLPGFEGIPLYKVLLFFFKSIQKGYITTRASSIAFNFFLAIFPSIIFIFTLIPYVPIAHFQDNLIDILQDILPTDAFKATQATITDIVKHHHSGLLSFGFFATLYFSTNGVNAMITAFNTSYLITETRSFLMQRLVALFLFIVQSIIIFIAIALIVFTVFLLHKLHFQRALAFYLIKIGQWIIVFILFFLLISLTYFLGPANNKKWRFISAGATFATFLCIVTSIGFTYYVNNFGKYNKLYGSIGTLIVIMMWIYFNSINILLGFELNASISHAKHGNAKMSN
ncbi:MAG: YihY/virulence factor BrkB family protein [Bacteroidia bacterium]